MVDENTTELINGAMDEAMMAAAAEDWPAVVAHCDRILDIDADQDAASRFRQLALLRLDEPPVAAPAPVADERRQLTVMFGDMVGSTQMSQVLDPDTLREMLRLYQDACTEAIAAWDGFIARWMGDGFMAYFGFPTPHEDAAYRAVMAGLSVIERIESLAGRFEEEFGVEVGIRLGVHTGLVVIADMGSGDWRQASDLVGETPNMAARLEASAPSNGVVISGETRDLVRGFVNLESLGPHELKGIDRLVEVYRVLDATEATSRYEAWADPSSPLVGRRVELARLTEAIERGGGDRGSLTVVTGEAGIGKSRLIHEARARLAARREVLACSGVEMTTSEPLAPVQRLFVTSGGLKISEPDAYGQIERQLAPFGVATPSIARVAASIGVEPPADVVLAAQTPEQTLRDVTAAYITWLAGIGRSRRALLVVDDLHWLDATSRDLLLQLRDAAPELPVVVASRPADDDQLVREADEVIELAALSTAETEELLAWFVGAGGGDVDYSDAITRSDGVPLFAEELGRVLTEQGSTALAAIPATLHDLLAMRLDAMPEAKPVAQVAAAIGRDFEVDVLERVLGAPVVREHLPALLESGVWVRGNSPGRIAFRHALLADAAYDSQVRARKVEVNRSIADTLLADFPALAASAPHQIAHHREAAEQFDDAVALWLQAGMATAGQGAHVEAMEHYRRGLAILDRAEEGPMRLQVELGLRLGLGASISSTAGYGHPDVQTGFARAQEICSLFGTLPDLFPALWGSWSFYLVTADYDTAASLAADISAIAEAAEDRALEMEAAAVEGITAFYRGDLVAADAFFSRTEELFAESPEVSASQQFQHPLVAALSNAALVRWLRGDAKAAVSAIRRAVEVSESCDPRLALFARGYAATFGGALGSLTGDASFELEHAQEAIDVCHEFGSQMFLAGGEMYKGHAQAAVGSEAEGLARLEAATEGYVMTGALLMRPYHLSCLADVRQRAGDLDGAGAALDEALDVGQRVGERAFVPHVRTRRAEVEIARSGVASDEAARALEVAADEAAANGDVMTQLRARSVLHEAGHDQRDAISALLAAAPALDPDHPTIRAARNASGQ